MNPQAVTVDEPTTESPQSAPLAPVFSGHTGFFPPRLALHMAAGDKLTGVLRFELQPHRLEVYFFEGKFLFATTRDVLGYCRGSSVILSQTSLGAILEAQAHQQETSCPIFLHIAQRGGFPHDDVVQITREHGQRAFARVWTAGRVAFEFQALPTFPDYVKNFPVSSEDPDNWALGSLRFVRIEDIGDDQKIDPAGSPAYTRKGYELIQRLKLNDIEARFATAINGTDSLAAISDKVGVALNDAMLIAFRLMTLEVIDYWNWSTLSLPAAAPSSQNPQPAKPGKKN